MHVCPLCAEFWMRGVCVYTLAHIYTILLTCMSVLFSLSGYTLDHGVCSGILVVVNEI